MRTTRIRVPCGKVSTSPVVMSRPGRLTGVPFTRTWPLVMRSAAIARVLKNRACQSHLSSRNRCAAAGWTLPEGPAKPQTLPFSARSAAKGLSGSIGFSARGGRASNDFCRSSRSGLPPLRSARRSSLGLSPLGRSCFGRSPFGRSPGGRSARGAQHQGSRTTGANAAGLIHINPPPGSGRDRGGTHLARSLHAGPEQASLQASLPTRLAIMIAFPSGCVVIYSCFDSREV